MAMEQVDLVQQSGTAPYSARAGNKGIRVRHDVAAVPALEHREEDSARLTCLLMLQNQHAATYKEYPMGESTVCLRFGSIPLRFRLPSSNALANHPPYCIVGSH